MKHSAIISKLFSLFQFKTNHSATAADPFHETELTGRWAVYMPKPLQHAWLEISSEGTGRYNTQPLKGFLPQSNPDQLVLKDHFGYRLVIEKQDDEHYFLFDELNDAVYPIKRI